jgi:hypothetical protein
VLTLAEQTREHKMADPCLLISLTQSYLPLTQDLSRSKVHSLSRLAKRLGEWVRACSLAGNGVVQESRRRSKDPLNMQVT